MNEISERIKEMGKHNSNLVKESADLLRQLSFTRQSIKDLKTQLISASKDLDNLDNLVKECKSSLIEITKEIEKIKAKLAAFRLLQCWSETDFNNSKEDYDIAARLYFDLESEVNTKSADLMYYENVKESAFLDYKILEDKLKALKNNRNEIEYKLRNNKQIILRIQKQISLINKEYKILSVQKAGENQSSVLVSLTIYSKEYKVFKEQVVYLYQEDTDEWFKKDKKIKESRQRYLSLLLTDFLNEKNK